MDSVPIQYWPIIAAEMILASVVAVVLYGWASQRFRHKTQKRSFRIQFGSTVALNLAGIAWILSCG